jgi:hypothetical protein
MGLGVTIVRNLGDNGGPVASRVEAELDALVAWAKTSPRVIHVDFSTVGNVGAGPDVLHTYTLPANSLATDGDFLRVRYAGRFAGDADTKTIDVRFGGVSAISLAETQGVWGWLYDITYIRTTATTVLFAVNVSWGRLRVPAGGALTDDGLFQAEVTGLTIANLNSNTMLMEVQGGDAGSETDDVRQFLSTVELYQQ